MVPRRLSKTTTVSVSAKHISGKAKLVGRVLGQALEAPDGVVAQPAHCPAEEARQPGRDRGREAGQGAADVVERVGLADTFFHDEAVAVGTQAFDLGAPRPDHAARPHAGEAVGCPLLAAHHALEQERVRSSAQLGKDRNRRIRVGQPLAIHEAQAPLPGEVEEAGAVGNEDSHGEVAGDYRAEAPGARESLGPVLGPQSRGGRMRILG